MTEGEEEVGILGFGCHRVFIGHNSLITLNTISIIGLVPLSKFKENEV